ncbi:MAG TPA: IPTL-CTERM sorting domain-containing protein [Xanthomonadales bacterium]|nr:IPTL-CTERM sorting domain-containing protein [Xanthomonadales bacterium]
MKFIIRSGLAAALIASSAFAFAQERQANTPESPEVLNADSSSFISVPDGGPVVEDGSFEDGSPNAFWNEFSTNFGTPLCTALFCGTGTGTGPNTGDWWAWFGGIGAFENGTVSQDVTFPNGAATLTFFLEAIICDSASDYLEVTVDGTQVFLVDGSSPLCGVLGYTEQTVDVSAWADGGVHTLEFNSEIFANNVGGSNFFVDDVSIEGTEPPAEARFLVSKTFDDGNPAEVDVLIECNTGLPLSQPATISAGDPVNFVVVDFEQGELSCTVTEVTPDGYTASYNDGDGVSDTECSWEDLSGGQYACAIDNTLDESEVEVTKVWIDENPQFDAVNIADALWSCSNVSSVCDEDEGFGNSCNSGSLDFFGNPATDSFYVYPDWDGGTTCNVTEVFLPDGGVEVDDSDCQGITLFPGDSGSCTIYNTRLYEGIPTLSQYGLGVLVLLMMGVGMVAFRRFV